MLFGEILLVRCHYGHLPHRHHFHHKFAVIDGHVLLNGSYNWTRSADMNNRENFMLSEEPTLVRRYARAFDALWAELGTEAGAPERR